MHARGEREKPANLQFSWSLCLSFSRIIAIPITVAQWILLREDWNKPDYHSTGASASAGKRPRYLNPVYYANHRALHPSIPASFHSHCRHDLLKSRLVEDFVTPNAISYSLPRSPRWLSRIMAQNDSLRWLCDVVPVLSDHESDRYSAWELNDLFTGRQRVNAHCLPD